MSFSQTIVLLDNTLQYNLSAFVPLDLEIDPFNTLTDEYKIRKIKYLLNGEEFHTERLKVDDFTVGDPRTQKIHKQFLYEKSQDWTLNDQVIKIQLYAMTSPEVWEYTINLKLSYPDISSIEENIFFNDIKLVKTHISKENKMLYIFESSLEKIDDLTGAVENEKYLLPVNLEWLDSSSSVIVDDLIYDLNPYNIAEPFVTQNFDAEILMPQFQSKNYLNYNQKYTLNKGSLIKETFYQNTKTIDHRKKNYPLALDILEELKDFNFKEENIFIEDLNSNINYKFYTKKQTDWKNLKDPILIYIPNSFVLKKEKMNIFIQKIFDNDVGKAIEKHSKETFRIKKINSSSLEQELSSSEKTYINDIYVLLKV